MGIANDAMRLRRDRYVRAYLETALFAETGDDERPLDAIYDVDDFTDHAVIQAANELEKFQRDVDRVVEQLARATDRDADDIATWDGEQAARDLWFSRNGHGVGFFDRPEFYGELAQALQEVAHRQGTCNVIETGETGEDRQRQLEFM